MFSSVFSVLFTRESDNTELCVMSKKHDMESCVLVVH